MYLFPSKGLEHNIRKLDHICHDRGERAPFNSTFLPSPPSPEEDHGLGGNWLWVGALVIVLDQYSLFTHALTVSIQCVKVVLSQPTVLLVQSQEHAEVAGPAVNSPTPHLYHVATCDADLAAFTHTRLEVWHNRV